jgi:4,5-DOPA dioxygenase extradiol
MFGPTSRGFAMYDLPPPFKRLLPQDLDYATPPSDALASRIDGLLQGSGPIARSRQRGFDHTTWMPLLCLFPAADVPVLELAYPYVPEADLFALGRRLAPLRDEGVMFIASGGMTHNLAAASLPLGAPTPSWAREFDAWSADKITALDVDALVDFRHKAPAVDLAHPDDGAHFRVLLAALGVLLGDVRATGAKPRVTFPVASFESALSTRCAELG